jgi:hypothetical protein
MRIASRGRPEGRVRVPVSEGAAVITWEHDGVDVDSFIIEVDGVEYDIGADSPDTGTTYTAPWPDGVASGSHSVAVYAVNDDGRTTSALATLSKP